MNRSRQYLHSRRSQERGFTITEVVVAIGLFSVLMGIVLGNILSDVSHTRHFLAVTTRDRVWAGVRQIVGMPAAVRNSARMQVSGNLVNPGLYNCVYGATAGGCQSGQELPLSLYSPYFPIDSTGALHPELMQFVSMPCSPIRTSTCTEEGALKVIRFNEFGTACNEGESGCAFLVFTSFTPVCGPATLPQNPPADLLSPSNLLAPLATCTVADYIMVNFQVKVDPNSQFGQISEKVGFISVKVKEISFNDPQ